MKDNFKVEQQADTLETEVKKFANGLPFWAKFLADKILSGITISDYEIDTSYSYMLEHLKLQKETQKPEISIDFSAENSENYKNDLLLTKLENVEGVNALAENQTIEFNPNLTIVYGANGSGKSSYIRLLKKVFYSKAPESILPNVHNVSGRKSINAKFTFKSNNVETSFSFADKENAEFEQFAVFDGNSVLKHLENKNEFEFRPSGLSFFAEYTNSIIRIEQKLNTEIQTKQIGNTAEDLSALFDGDSEIKTLVNNLKAETKIDELNKYTPFTDEDKTQRDAIQKQYDELLLASKGKEKELKMLEGIKSLLAQNKKAIENLNQFFTTEVIEKVRLDILDFVSKEEIAKSEGVEKFKTDKIDNVGTTEWKNFIVSAQTFAKMQKTENAFYPENGDNCLLCQQPLLDEAQKLISNYWTLIKSVAEQNAKQSQEKLKKIKGNYENLNFVLFPQDNILTIWLAEKYPNELKSLEQKLSDLKTLAQIIIANIQSKTAGERVESKVCIKQHDTIETAIDNSIKLLKDDGQIIELEKSLNAKTFLEHKEKFNIHFSKFEAFVNNQIWMSKAGKADYAKRKITETEKSLSNKYFNQKYIDAFNEECLKLNGNFGIDINHTGTAGKSYRQLKLKGKNPNSILSEGEQKVIAIADFLAEMQLSEVNKGIIFDDPVTSLDERRKSEIAERLAKEALQKQVIIFTHDLVFVSSLISHCKETNTLYDCHWIENVGGNQPGTIWLKNTPSFEKDYKTSGKAQGYYNEAKKSAPKQREDNIKNGFAALRTSYETLVVFELFKGVVQRFEERVSVDSLKSVFFTLEIRDEILDSFYKCCRYMEGHSHSDKYAYKKPELENLNEEIQRFNTIKKKIGDLNKNKPSP